MPHQSLVHRLHSIIDCFGVIVIIDNRFLKNSQRRVNSIQLVLLKEKRDKI